METRLLSPEEIPGNTRPPITLRPTWVRLSSAITADTCREEDPSGVCPSWGGQSVEDWCVASTLYQQ